MTRETWLVPEANRFETPNAYAPGHPWIRDVELVVLHFTVGYRRSPSRVNGAVAWLTNPDARASAHFVVDEARVFQLAPLEGRTWHAGGKASRWRGKVVNVRSIGVEIANLGLLYRAPNGELLDHWKQAPRGKVFEIPTRSYRELAGPERFAVVERLYRERELPVPDRLPWDDYPASQVRLVAALLDDLADRYPVLREDPDRLALHEETAPSYKIDPGPALWWRVQRWREDLAAGRPCSHP